jgi:predicted metal-dependent hydrolase
VRALYHGILQIGVGFHHWRNGNLHGASTLLDEGILRLQPFAPRCQGVDVEALIADARAARERLITLGAERLREVDVAAVAPRIRFAP